jgi:hypothetical protein
MKVAIKKEKKERKKQSWGIRFSEKVNTANVYILAVDMETDEHICLIQTWSTNGEIFCDKGAKECLIEKGYDPFEHGNSFDEKGAIIVS